MVLEFQHMKDEQFCHVRAVRQRIKLPSLDERPIHSAPYRARHHSQRFEKHEIDEMLAMYVIEAAQTTKAASILFEPKKNRTFRFCVEYHKLSAVTNWNFYPISLDAGMHRLSW